MGAQRKTTGYFHAVDGLAIDRFRRKIEAHRRPQGEIGILIGEGIILGSQSGGTDFPVRIAIEHKQNRRSVLVDLFFQILAQILVDSLDESERPMICCWKRMPFWTSSSKSAELMCSDML
jgi:hypothetical protein